MRLEQSHKHQMDKNNQEKKDMLLNLVRKLKILWNIKVTVNLLSLCTYRTYTPII